MNATTKVSALSRFFIDCGFTMQVMGNGATAWANMDSDVLGAEILISDGQYHAPESWAVRASVQVNLLDRTGDTIASYGRTFENIMLFRDWYDSAEGEFFATRSSDAEFTEEHLTAVGFGSLD